MRNLITGKLNRERVVRTRTERRNGFPEDRGRIPADKMDSIYGNRITLTISTKWHAFGVERNRELEQIGRTRTHAQHCPRWTEDPVAISTVARYLAGNACTVACTRFSHERVHVLARFVRQLRSCSRILLSAIGPAPLTIDPLVLSSNTPLAISYFLPNIYPPGVYTTAPLIVGKKILGPLLYY